MSALPETLVMASGNTGKIRELTRLLRGLGTDIVAQSELGVEEADETGSSFVENALIKARHAATTTGLPAIADDSGLVVDALGGAPGIYSARYSGAGATDEQNIDKLLTALRGTESAARGAAFRCAACFVLPGQEAALVAEGEWRGAILSNRQGDGGFGYDPVFLDPASGASAAMLSAEQKNVRSHRGQALRKLVALIEQEYS